MNVDDRRLDGQKGVGTDAAPAAHELVIMPYRDLRTD